MVQSKRPTVRLFHRISSHSDPTKMQTKQEAWFLDFWACTRTGIRTTYEERRRQTLIYTRKSESRKTATVSTLHPARAAVFCASCRILNFATLDSRAAASPLRDYRARACKRALDESGASTRRASSRHANENQKFPQIDHRVTSHSFLVPSPLLAIARSSII